MSMMSVRECTRRYNEMSKTYEAKAEPNRVNCYQCDKCGSITKTIDVDDGVTPFYYQCEHCKNPVARSTMYYDIAPNQKPTQEWYRPTLKEVLKLRKNPSMLEYILNGGLDVRPIIQE